MAGTRKRNPEDFPYVPGDCPLTPAEYAAILHLADGHTIQTAAHAEHITTSGLRSTLRNAYQRLGANNGTHAVVMCIKAGWITFDDVNPHAHAIPTTPQRQGRILITPQAIRQAVATMDRVKAAHRVYLYAFDLHTHAKTDPDRKATRAIMTTAAHDAGIPIGTNPHRRDRNHDFIDFLARTIQTERATT